MVPSDHAGNSHPPAFSHPSEEFFSRILDYYGIEWQYEPHAFPLEFYPDGRVKEAFSPDFYLPQQNLYIELTTLRPKLNLYKNRRMRRFKELYPDIKIKLFKRRDLRNLMIRFGLDHEAEAIFGTQAQKRDE